MGIQENDLWGQLVTTNTTKNLSQNLKSDIINFF